jgi:hypothetical protein
MNEKTYKIVRYYKDSFEKKIIKHGLSLLEAKEHCEDDETASNTCQDLENIKHTAEHGHWFDSFAKE